MQPEPTILAFDTSAAHCAAALLMDGKIVAERHEGMPKGQAERLFPLLEEVLDEAGCGWSDLSLIGVGTGPGNFTGIRIGVAAARGLSLSLGIPARGVDRFDALAFGYEGVVVASVPAPRDEVYVRVIDKEENAPLVGVAETMPLAVPARAAPTCIGAEAETFALRFAGQVAAPLHSLSESIARITLSRAGHASAPPAPLYIRPADAAPPKEAPPEVRL